MNKSTFRYKDSDIYVTKDGYILTKEERLFYEKTGHLPETLTYQPKDGKITLCINERQLTYRVARLVWEAVNGVEICTTDSVVHYKGEDPNVPNIKDIDVMARKDFFMAYPEKTHQAMFDEATCEIIRNEYNQEERQKHSFKGEWATPSYKELAIKWNCSKSTIYKIVRGVYKCKKKENSCC